MDKKSKKVTLETVHMETIGTQNDLLKFKEEIVLSIIKSMAHTDTLKASMRDVEVRVFALEKSINAKMDELLNRLGAAVTR